jgi:V8-like Glu-specific endopeptidase
MRWLLRKPAWRITLAVVLSVAGGLAAVVAVPRLASAGSGHRHAAAPDTASQALSTSGSASHTPSTSTTQPSQPSTPGQTGSGSPSTTRPTPGAPGTGSPTGQPTTVGPGQGGAAGSSQEGPAVQPMTASNPLTGSPFPGTPAVGALFTKNPDGSLGGSYCTASVVNSSTGDIVVTAAHCVAGPSGTAVGLLFVPGYHDGQTPYGVWPITQVFVDPHWQQNSDPDYDVAFLVVKQTNSAIQVQDVIGGVGEQLAVNPGYTDMVRVIGYPAGQPQPVQCQNSTTEMSPTQLQWDCANYPGGTSGGPFLANVDPTSGLGTVVGVIGGYQTGGNTPAVSYSAYFGGFVQTLYDQATAAG